MADRRWAAAILVVTLTGCASVDAASDGAVSSGAPAPVAGYDWLLSEDASEVRLAYGQAASDDLALALSCVPASGRVTLSQPAPDGSREIHLESGGETERFAATSEPSGIHDGAFLTASATPDAPIFQRFRTVGWMAVLHADSRRPLVAQPGTTPDIARFFQLCG